MGSQPSKHYRTLGRTGLKVSVLGMGTGGHDPLGACSGRTEREMINLLRRAFDLGINLFDTSPLYGDGRSERLLGKALYGLPMKELVVATKIPLAGGYSDLVIPMDRGDIAPAVETSLRRLRRECVDVLLMSVASPKYFNLIMNEHLPELEKLQQQGKIRFLGSSEQTRSDGSHQWLQTILPTDVIDVAMVGHNMINQSAQRTVFPLCQQRNIGVLNVFTVRNLFWNVEHLREVIDGLKSRGVVSGDVLTEAMPLDWLLDDEVGSLVEAAYRYAAYTAGVTSVISGTIEATDLEKNFHTLLQGPLSKAKQKRLQEVFGRVAEAIGN